MIRLLFKYYWGGGVTGVEGGIVVAKCEKEGWGFGYNAATGEYLDLLEAGVLDPAKVSIARVGQRRARTQDFINLVKVLSVIYAEADCVGALHGVSESRCAKSRDAIDLFTVKSRFERFAATLRVYHKDHRSGIPCAYVRTPLMWRATTGDDQRRRKQRQCGFLGPHDRVPHRGDSGEDLGAAGTSAVRRHGRGQLHVM